MAGTSFMKRVASVSLDIPMAALAALSVAFVLYAMPAPFFAEALGATGLSRLMPGVEPAGMTARIGVIAAGAILTFLLVWLVLRALGEGGSRYLDERDEVAPEIPRLRRADVHPDAPSRRPLFAGRELGEPFDEAAPVETAPAETAPAETAPVEVAPIEAQPVAEEPPLKLVREESAPKPVVAATEGEEYSIVQLMERLERGLAARQRRNVVELEPEPVQEPEQAQTRATDARPEPAPAAPVASPEDPIDQRLRSALDHLQRLAARGA